MMLLQIFINTVIFVVVLEQFDKLTNEEISSVNGFADLSAQETEALANFIYNISFILYKTHDNGKS